ncbi:MAG: hypothetical protein AAB786_00400 [Patescibacteria group bacterium]
MYILLILFFLSFFGIILMIGRKLALLRNGQIVQSGEILLRIPSIEKIKDLTLVHLKKYGHLGLVFSIRFYIRAINFLKEKYEEVKIKIKNINMPKDLNGNRLPNTEGSKFLKMISDYKHKIREIKQRIHEEENNS